MCAASRRVLVERAKKLKNAVLVRYMSNVAVTYLSIPGKYQATLPHPTTLTRCGWSLFLLAPPASKNGQGYISLHLFFIVDVCTRNKRIHIHTSLYRFSLLLRCSRQFYTPPKGKLCLLYTSPSPRDKRQSRMPSSA